MSACTALIAVAGRLAQPEKNPDSMDIVLQWLGGAMGFVMIRIYFSRKILTAPLVRGASSRDESPHAHKTRHKSMRVENE
jgi:hypothetical protein